MNNDPRLSAAYRLIQFANQWQQCFIATACGMQHDQAETSGTTFLLMQHVRVHSDKYVKLLLDQTEQFSI